MQKQKTVFYVDRCLGGKKLVKSLREMGVTVEAHDDHFPMDAQDQDWLPKVASWGWIVLTRDKMIGRRNLERLAVATSQASLFVLVIKEAHINKIIEAFTKALPEMIIFVEKNDSPFIAKVYSDGKVMAWQDSNDLDDFKNKLLGT